MTGRPVVRIVDDDAALTEGLAFLLESEGWTVQVYESAQAFLKNDVPSVRGCLVLDVRMPGMTGLELQHVMNERGYNLPIIFLTGHGDIDMAVSTIKQGAVEFLQKTGDNARLVEAVSRAVARSMEGFAQLDQDPYEAQKRWRELTEREAQLLTLIAKGQRNRDVAERLGLSVRTVEAHRASAFRKLGIKTVAELSSLMHLLPERASST